MVRTPETDVRVSLALVLALCIALAWGMLPPPSARAQAIGPNTMVSNLGKVAVAPELAQVIEQPFNGSSEQAVDGLVLAAEPARLFSLQGPFTPGSVIGEDGRTRKKNTTTYPFRANVLIENDFGASHFMCTGWFIGPRTIATAGHCVYDPDSDQWATKIVVYPGRNGNSAPYGSAEACLYWSVSGWTQDGSPKYDYGAIILKPKQALGNTVGWYGFRTASDGALNGMNVSIFGYPADKSYGTQWGMAGQISKVSPRQVHYEIDTYGGQSGSAVYQKYKGECCYGVGVHAYGASGTPPLNSGTRIVSAVFDNLRYWKYNPDCSP